MILSPRLLEICNLVEPGSLVSDIGTDHGFIPAYLIKQGKIAKAVLSDINQGPIENAKATFKEAEIFSQGRFLLAGGLSKLTDEELDNVIIAGMGGLMIEKILQDDFDKAKVCKKLILQPMQNKKELREYLCVSGFNIVDESIIKEDRRFYEIIVAQYDGRVRTFDDIYYEIGLILPTKIDDTYREFLIDKKESFLRAMEKMKNTKTQAGIRRLKDFKDKVGIIDNLLTKK